MWCDLLQLCLVTDCLDFSSRGDTQQYSDLNKLARRFLKGSQNSMEGEVKDLPSKAYIQEVVEELRNGEDGECPICLEAFEDAVLTPCAHRLCRECLLASWRNATSGFCPVCRYLSNIFLSVWILLLVYLTVLSYFVLLLFLYLKFIILQVSDLNFYFFCRKFISKQDLITAPTESRFQVDIDKNWVESTKVAVLLRELEMLRISGSKSIVFSQWTAFLDILEIPLSR